jgi:hypothetical protein
MHLHGNPSSVVIEVISTRAEAVPAQLKNNGTNTDVSK